MMLQSCKSTKSIGVWFVLPHVEIGVEQDGWRFVLLARFSPIPSYVINYALSATGVGFVMDFILPNAVGCLPIILQNTAIGSLAGAAVASASGSKKSKVEDLLRMYRLFSKIPRGLDPVSSILKQHVIAKGAALVKQAEDPASSKKVYRFTSEFARA